MEQKQEGIWRVWVNPEKRIVSFHPEEGYQMLEFRSRETFLHCVDEYTHRQFRYQ